MQSLNGCCDLQTSCKVDRGENNICVVHVKSEILICFQMIL